MGDELAIARLRKEVEKWKKAAVAFKTESVANERRATKAEMVLKGLLQETAPYMPTFVLSGKLSRLQGAREMARSIVESSGEDIIEKVLDLLHDLWDSGQITFTDHNDKDRVERMRHALHQLKWKGRSP